MAFIHDDASYQTEAVYRILNARIDSGTVDIQIIWTSESTDTDFALPLASPFPWNTAVPEGLRMAAFRSNLPSGVETHIAEFKPDDPGTFVALVTNTTGTDQLCSTVVTYEVL